jgi:hypothetical protein
MGQKFRLLSGCFSEGNFPAWECHKCKQPLIQVDNRRLHLVDCLICNRWTDRDGNELELSEKDLVALYALCGRTAIAVTKKKPWSREPGLLLRSTGRAPRTCWGNNNLRALGWVPPKKKPRSTCGAAGAKAGKTLSERWRPKPAPIETTLSRPVASVAMVQ